MEQADLVDVVIHMMVLLNLQDQVLGSFNSEVRRLVSEQLHNDNLLQSLLQSVVVEACRNDGLTLNKTVELLLPESELVDFKQDSFNQLVLSVSREMFDRGIELKLGRHKKNGLCIRLTGQGIEVDMVDDTLSQLLLEHLQPRFRDLLQGVFHS